jgi:hypothetical protein
MLPVPPKPVRIVTAELVRIWIWNEMDGCSRVDGARVDVAATINPATNIAKEHLGVQMVLVGARPSLRWFRMVIEKTKVGYVYNLNVRKNSSLWSAPLLANVFGQ